MKKEISSLPLWAQEQMAELTEQRDAALRHLNEFAIEKGGAFSYVNKVATKGKMVLSVVLRKLDTRNMRVKHKNILLDIKLGQTGIELEWGCGAHGWNAAGFIPTGYQKAELVPELHQSFLEEEIK